MTDQIFRLVHEPSEPMIAPPQPDPFAGDSPWFTQPGGFAAVAAEEWAIDWCDDTKSWVPEYMSPPGFEDDPTYLEFDVVEAGALARWEARLHGKRIICTKRDVPTPALVLVGCGEAKRKVPSLARELYNSSLFAAHWKLARRYNVQPQREDAAVVRCSAQPGIRRSRPGCSSISSRVVKSSCSPAKTTCAGASSCPSSTCSSHSPG